MKKSKVNPLKKLRASLSENIELVYQMDDRISFERDKWIQGFNKNDRYLQEEAASNINTLQFNRFDQIAVVAEQINRYRKLVPHQTFVRDNEIRLFREHEIIVLAGNYDYIHTEYKQLASKLVPNASADGIRRRLADMGESLNNNTLMMNMNMESYIEDYGMGRLLAIPGINDLKKQQEEENQSQNSSSEKSTLRRKLSAAREEELSSENVSTNNGRFTINEAQFVMDTNTEPEKNAVLTAQMQKETR